MTATVFFSLIFLAALGSGLMAGVFFAFSVFVMRGLKRLPAAQGIAAMQAINVAVINPLFMTVFLGTGVCCSAILVFVVLMWPYSGIGYLAVGALLYIAGCIGVTMLCNVPRNNALAAVAPESAAGADYWPHYVREWTRWNHVRTVACALAMAVFVVAMG
jgi:uncharacterized membrane protein